MRLTIGMMVKNEERNLPRCLDSLQPLLAAVESELVIVDTGSTDATVEIAKRYTERVYHRPWNNNFSEMRNIVIEYARGEWFLVIDADEELQHVKSLVDFLKSKRRNAYGAVAISCKNISNPDEATGFSMMTTLRLFKNDGHFSYQGAVHNQPVFRGEAVAFLDVLITHYGYISTDAELMERKFLRTSAILKSELEQDPTNIYYLAQLAGTYGMHGDYEEARVTIERAYELLPEKRTPDTLFVFIQLAVTYQQLKRHDKVEAVCLEALEVRPDSLDARYYLAEAKAVQGKYSEAIERYLEYLELYEQRERSLVRDTSIIEYSQGYRDMVFYNLVKLCKLEGEYEKGLEFVQRLSIEKDIETTVEEALFIQLKAATARQLRGYYEERIKGRFDDVFFDKLELLLLSDEFLTRRMEVAQAFADCAHPYALLCQWAMAMEKATPAMRNELAAIDVGSMPTYCSGLFYHMLRLQEALPDNWRRARETWLNCIAETCKIRYADFADVLGRYLTAVSLGEDVLSLKVEKILCRYALLLGQEQDVFERYVRAGSQWLEFLYNEQVLTQQWLMEMKNDEEIFLLHMRQARLCKTVDPAAYVRNLRLALKAMPDLKWAVEGLLKSFEGAAAKEPPLDAMTELLQSLQREVEGLIERGESMAARAAVQEAEKILGNAEPVLLQLKEQLAGKA